MRNLLNFLIRYCAWFVFAGYVVLSCWFLFRNNPYQQHVYLTSANAVSSAVYDASNTVTGYVNLRSINADMQRRMAELESEAVALRSQNRLLRESLLQDSLASQDSLKRFNFIVATVINNSISHPNNYMTINKGRCDGVQPEMGVIDRNGVVGVVNVVADHHSRIISLLNPNFRLSCKLRGNDAFGSLVWDGKSPYEAILEELPKQVKFREGDTIVTSGYSAMFPEGLPVGIILSTTRGRDDNFNTLRIKLLTDFTSLSDIRVISNPDLEDIRAVESGSN